MLLIQVRKNSMLSKIDIIENMRSETSQKDIKFHVFSSVTFLEHSMVTETHFFLEIISLCSLDKIYYMHTS